MAETNGKNASSGEQASVNRRVHVKASNFESGAGVPEREFDVELEGFSSEAFPEETSGSDITWPTDEDWSQRSPKSDVEAAFVLGRLANCIAWFYQGANTFGFHHRATLSMQRSSLRTLRHPLDQIDVLIERFVAWSQTRLPPDLATTLEHRIRTEGVRLETWDIDYFPDDLVDLGGPSDDDLSDYDAARHAQVFDTSPLEECFRSARNQQLQWLFRAGLRADQLVRPAGKVADEVVNYRSFLRSANSGLLVNQGTVEAIVGCALSSGWPENVLQEIRDSADRVSANVAADLIHEIMTNPLPTAGGRLDGEPERSAESTSVLTFNGLTFDRRQWRVSGDRDSVTIDSRVLRPTLELLFEVGEQGIFPVDLERRLGIERATARKRISLLRELLDLIDWTITEATQGREAEVWMLIRKP